MGCCKTFDNVFIRTTSMILPDVKIGPNAIIGAGSVVTKAVLPGTVVADVPAATIGLFDAFVKTMSLWKRIYWIRKRRTQ